MSDPKAGWYKVTYVLEITDGWSKPITDNKVWFDGEGWHIPFDDFNVTSWTLPEDSNE